nr:DUF47 family protein [Candidatus Gracilibacteria bacterium]
MFFPKNTNYGKFFQNMAGDIVEISTLFNKLVVEFKDFDKYSKKAEIIEKQVDGIAHEIITELNTSFITPFDREDLHLLALEVDNIVDGIEDVINMINLYNIGEKHGFLDDFSNIYNDLSITLSLLISETFKSKRNLIEINKYATTIKMLERQADDVYLKSIQKIFLKEKDPIELIKWKDILEKLETITDEYNSVSNSILNMVIKMG